MTRAAHLIMAGIFAVSAALATGCGESDPCGKLAGLICESVGTELCADLKKAPATEGQDAACAAVLADERKLADTIAVATAAAQVQKSAPKPAAD